MSKDPARRPDPARLTALAPVAGKLRLAGLALLWERLWPKLVAPLAILGVFLGVAFLRLTDGLPDAVRLGIAGLLLAALLASLWPLIRITAASPLDAVDRLERDNHLDGRPLRSLTERQVTGISDPLGVRLWQAHQARAMQKLSGLKVELPSPRVDKRDPYALRAAAFLFFVVAVASGRGDYVGSLKSMLALPGEVPPEIRIDAWVTPPAYTGEAPRFLSAATGDDKAANPPMTIPEGSHFAIRILGLEKADVRFIGEGADPAGIALTPAAETANLTPATDATVEKPARFSWVFGASGKIEVFEDTKPVAEYAFTIKPDTAPTIKLSEAPSQTVRGAFRLVTETSDDYRVASARAVFTNPEAGGEALRGAITANPRPLIGPPEFPLKLSRKGATKPSVETLRDLSAHPWAGGKVTMTLEATDDAGNIGRAEPQVVTIPQRPFRAPLAKMLVEQRRILAKDANAAGFVVQMIDTVSDFLPEFNDDPTVVIGLRVIRNRIIDAREDADLVAVLDLMWQMALAVDGGDASLAEQALREAREKLRDALQNGASPEEIARLTEELKKALNDYMEALQKQAEDNPQLAQKPSENTQTVTPEDFQKLMDQMQEMSRLGDREAAEQLLSQLDQMLENLQTAQPQPGQNGDQQSQMSQQMNQLADMIRRQQELMNETHKLTPDGEPLDGSGPDAAERQQKLDQLQGEQQALQDQLNKLMQEMQKNGGPAGEELGKAEEKMKGAGEQLGEGDPGQALADQGQALDQMRKGAQSLAQQMAEQEGQGQGRKPGENAAQNDPLGRPEKRKGPDYGDQVKVPGEIEVQRARRVLDELRRRFSDPARPTLELDYLKRLLSPF